MELVWASRMVYLTKPILPVLWIPHLPITSPKLNTSWVNDDLVQVQDWCLQTLSQVEEFEKASRVYQLGSRPKEVPEELKRRVSLICQPTSNETTDHWRDLVVLHSLVTHFSVQGDEALRTFVFRHLYSNNSSHLDSLYRLSSLALTTNQTRVLEQVAHWIKFHSDASNLTKLLLSDLSMLDPSANDVLSILPKTSLLFAEAFALALTDTFSYTSSTLRPPPAEILSTVLSWITNYPELLLVTASSHYDSDSKPRNAAIGLLRWTAGQAWSGVQSDDGKLLSNIHYSCLKFLGSRENVSVHNRGTFQPSQLKQVLKELESNGSGESEVGVNYALTRIAQFVQVCYSMGYFGLEMNEVKQCFQSHARHDLISMVLRKLA